jgi:ferredoxin-NADP reductase
MVQKIRLIGKEVVARDTMAFVFEKPRDFTFRAGQFCDITLVDPPETDAEGGTRGFSLARAPYESGLMVATRLRDTAFKRVLRDAPVGTEVTLDAPYGDFTLHKTETTPAVFLIGGIGVTPVRSMIAQATHDKTAHKMVLLHVNRTSADAPFTSDFERFARDNPNFTFVPIASQEGKGKWGWQQGRIDEALLTRYVPALTGPIYYLSGPQGMVKAMRVLLISLDVSEDSIRTEEFTGY